jgi:hypothetical protein
MGRAKPLHLRLFLEGQEVPVVSAQVQAGLWAPATAAIQIVPLDSALDFKPRTMVHLFYLEEPKVTDTNKRVDLTDGLGTDLADTAYKLFFCGEIAGFSFVKTPMSRAVILQCLDHSSYWDQLQATMMDYGPQGNAFVSKASFYASDAFIFANVPTQNQKEKLRSWILGKPKTPGWENIGGLAGGILNMMEQMSGVRGWRLGVNDFYSLAEMRCHLLGQVAADVSDNTSQKLLDTQVFFDWLYNDMQNQSGQVSLRDMMKLLCQYIYYQIAPNPIAKYDPASDKPRQVTYGPKDIILSKSPYFSICQTIILDCVMGLNENKTGRTRNDVQQLSTKVTKTLCGKLNSKVMPNIAFELPQKALDLSAALISVLAAWDAANQADITKTTATAYKIAVDLDAALTKAQKTKAYTTKGGSYEVSEKARLRTQIFRPDCFMSAPPTCNVIFPEQYTQLTYDRNFLSEVTRVEISLYSKIVGQNALTAAHFMEPNLRGVANEVVKRLGDKWRVLMDHELHTGIIGREEWLPDSFNVSKAEIRGDDGAKVNAHISWVAKTGLHHFFKYRIGPRLINVAGRFMPQVVCGFPALVIQKPFPMKSLPEDETTAIDLILNSNNPGEELGAPPQFLGMVEGISHSVGQDGGFTQISMSHCRNHLGIDDEFVGVTLAKERATKTTSGRTQTRLDLTRVRNDTKMMDFLRRATPSGAGLTSATSVTNQELTKSEATYQKKTYIGGAPVWEQKTTAVTAPKDNMSKANQLPGFMDAIDPLLPAGAVIKVPRLTNGLTTGSKGPAGGKVRLIEVHDPTIVEIDNQNYFQSITIYEDLTESISLDSPVPVEYVVRPSWLSDAYDNERIGPKIYDQFFGCNSIVDMISLSDIGSIPERPDERGMSVTIEEDRAEIEKKLSDIHSKRNFYSIEKAVNLISYLYGKVKSKDGADVDEFVSTFTWRPIATKQDLLGSTSLKVKVDNDVVTVDKESGVIGFHTLSVSEATVDAGRLVGLMEDSTVKMARMGAKELEAVRASYDVRKEKLDRIRAYVRDLTEGKMGFQG